MQQTNEQVVHQFWNKYYGGIGHTLDFYSSPCSACAHHIVIIICKSLDRPGFDDLRLTSILGLNYNLYTYYAQRLLEWKTSENTMTPDLARSLTWNSFYDWNTMKLHHFRAKLCLIGNFRTKSKGNFISSSIQQMI